MRKNTGDRERNENGRDQYPSIEDRSRDGLSTPGASAKQIQPTNDHDRQTKHAEERLFMCREIVISEDGLYRAWPNNK